MIGIILSNSSDPDQLLSMLNKTEPARNESNPAPQKYTKGG
jgi:hypothetical protein